jgi:hypothetical protein
MHQGANPLQSSPSMDTYRALDWDAHTGCTIRIYRNLNNGRMSIQAKVSKSWKVVGHVTDAVVKDVSFKVVESGRQRVIQEQCKNVHAWGQGVLISQLEPDIWAPVDLAYNPYAGSTFIERHTGREIRHCRYLVVRDN